MFGRVQSVAGVEREAMVGGKGCAMKSRNGWGGRRVRCLGVVALLAGGRVGLGQGCEWVVAPGASTSTTLTSGIMWDPDGPGPRHPVLVVSGTFFARGGTYAKNVALYDPELRQWSAFGAGMPSAASSFAVIHHADGRETLVANGSFPNDAGDIKTGVGFWDGVAWRLIAGLGESVTINSMTTLAREDGGEDLVVAGIFTGPEGTDPKNVAIWDGTKWHMMATRFGTVRPSVSSMIKWHPAGGAERLVISGLFSMIDGAPMNNVAFWNGSNWQTLGQGLSSTFDTVIAVMELPNASGGNDLYGVTRTTNALYRWTGSLWQKITTLSGTPSSVFVRDIPGMGPRVLACVSGKLQTWSGAAWAELGTGFAGTVTTAIDFTPPGGTRNLLTIGSASLKFVPTDGMARFDGSSWVADPCSIAIYDFGETLQTLPRADGGTDVVVGGTFQGPLAGRIGLWTNPGISRWRSGGLDNAVHVLEKFPNGAGEYDLIAGGEFKNTSAGMALPGIGRSDGVSWHPLDNGLSGRFFALRTVIEPSGKNVLYAAGTAIYIDGTTIGSIAKWDGSKSSPLLTPDGRILRSYASSIETYPNASGTQDILAGGGRFTLWPGSEFVGQGVVKWDGTTWSEFAPGLSLNVEKMLTIPRLDGGVDLYVCGSSSSTTSPPANTARWDGSRWEYLVETGADKIGFEAFSLEKMRNSTGGYDLLAVGEARLLPGLNRAVVAQWTGSSWRVLARPEREAGGTWTSLYKVMPFPSADDPQELMFTGRFGGSKEVSSVNFARLVRPTPLSIARSPEPVVAAQNDDMAVTCWPTAGQVGVRVRWQRNGVDVVDGPGGASRFGGVVSGASMALNSPTYLPATLRIAGVRAWDAGEYVAIFTNECGGEVRSESATVVVGPGPCPCSADFDQSGGTPDVTDIDVFFEEWQRAEPVADVDCSGGTPDGSDIEVFFAAWLAGGC